MEVRCLAHLLLFQYVKSGAACYMIVVLVAFSPFGGGGGGGGFTCKCTVTQHIKCAEAPHGPHPHQRSSPNHDARCSFNYFSLRI